MPATIPCLWFDTEAEEAANFYVSVFPNSRVVDVVRSGEEGPGPVGGVLTVEFDLDGQRYVGLNGGPQFTFNEAVSFQIMCADQDEVDHYWNRLTEGGEESQCGWLKDRFGLSWQVVPTAFIDMIHDPNPVKAQAATRCMLGMKKLDIAQLQAAYDAA
jgi:predicted 3-demethylubiquinone-9 3-methyltransferase (glyoxalase superfamily)